MGGNERPFVALGYGHGWNSPTKFSSQCSTDFDEFRCTLLQNGDAPAEPLGARTKTWECRALDHVTHKREERNRNRGMNLVPSGRWIRMNPCLLAHHFIGFLLSPPRGRRSQLLDTVCPILHPFHLLRICEDLLRSVVFSLLACSRVKPSLSPILQNPAEELLGHNSHRHSCFAARPRSFLEGMEEENTERMETHLLLWTLVCMSKENTRAVKWEV